MDNSKKQFYHDITTKVARLINLSLMTIPFAIAWYAFYADKLWVYFAMRGHWLVIGLYIILYYLIGSIYEAFKISYHGIGEMIYSQLLSLFEVNVMIYIVAWLLIRHIPNLLPVLGVMAVQVLASIIWSILSQKWYFATFPANKTIVVWDMREGIQNLIDQYNLEKKFKVVASVPVDDCIQDLSILDNADTVFLVGIHSHDRNIITKFCLTHNITAYLIPRVGDLIITGGKRTNLFHLLMLKVERYKPSLEYLIIKRMGDIILSLIALILFSPIMLITAISIKLEDHGPIIYKQIRLTKGGKEFNILKFRSMRIDAEKDGIARLSTGDADDRITKVGRIIRKTRIDEVPQLLNILAGHLSIVGPRAERPELVAKYQEELPEFALRLQVKAGLTGFAQVFGKYNSTPYDKLLMDLMYIANSSVFEDLRIIFATVKILFLPESTEGVKEEQTPAMECDKNVLRSNDGDEMLERWAN